MESIFDRFYRAANAADGADGFGIGLFVARSLVELHGGRIVVVSEPWRGSRFSFTLPTDAEDIVIWPDASRAGVGRVATRDGIRR